MSLGRAFGAGLGARLLALAASLSLVAGCATRGPPDVPAADNAPVRLRVIAFNDFHGHLEPGTLSLNLADPAGPTQPLRVAVGGAPALAGLVDALRASAPHSVLVSSGDMVGAAPLVSALFRHESTIDVMNQIGVDVAAPGNHEFDAGVTELQRLLRGGCGVNAADAAMQSCARQVHTGAHFPVVAANIEDAAGQTLFAPFWVQRYGTVRVGFIGAVTRSTPFIVVPSGVAGLRFTDEAAAINRSAAQLKAQGVNAMVVTMHEGGETGSAGQPADWNDPNCPQARGPGFEIARRLSPDIDLILTAHTHQGYNCLIGGRPVMQAVSFGRGVSVADLLIDPFSGRVVREQTVSRNLPVFNDRSDATQRAAIAAAQPEPYAAALRDSRSRPAITQAVAAYAAAAAPRSQRVVGRIVGDFDRRGRADSAAGRLVADAQWAATRAPDRGGAQLALMNPGGIRSDLACSAGPPCSVTYGDAFTMQPFGNNLVVMSLSGAELKALLEGQTAAGPLLSPSAGLSYRWLARAAPGQRVQELRLNGESVRPELDYRVTVNNFMADGGDGLSVLRQGRQRLGGPQDLDALLELLQTSPAPTSAPRIEWVD